MSNPKVIVGDGIAQRIAEAEAQYAHQCAAVAEGLCPVHRTAMHPVDMGEDTVIGAHCSPCGRYWWYDVRREETGWMLDYDPRTGNWHPPVRPGRGR